MADMTPEEINQRIRILEQQVAREKALTARATPQTADEKFSAVKDMAFQAPSAIAKGTAALVGMPGDIAKGVAAGANWLEGFRPEEVQNKIDTSGMAGTDEVIKQGIEPFTGPLRKPQTGAGEFVDTFGQILPSAMLGPGTIPRKAVGYALMPTIAAEGGGYAGEAIGGETGKTVGKTVGGLFGLGAGIMHNPLRSSKNLIADRLPPDAAERLNKLGPNAFLGEASDSTFSLMQGHTRPGKAMDVLREKVRGRDDLKGVRMQQAIDQNLGKARNPELIKEDIKANRAKLSPEFESELSKPILTPPQKAVAELKYLTNEMESGTTGIDLVEAKKALALLQPELEAAKQGMHSQGGRVTKVGIRQVFKAREALWSNIEKLEANQPTLASRLKRVYGLINEDLAKSPEIRDLNARYSQFSKEIDALDLGGEVFKKGERPMWPDHLSKIIDEATPQEVSRMMQGGRGYIEQVVGTNQHDVAEVRKLLSGVRDGNKFNREKMMLMFGPTKAEAIMKELKREVKMEESAGKILHNSQTAEKISGKEALSYGGAEDVPQGVGNAIMRIAKSGYDKTMGGIYAGRDLDVAKTLTRQSPNWTRDRELAELLSRSKNRKRGAPLVPGVSLMLSPWRTDQ